MVRSRPSPARLVSACFILATTLGASALPGCNVAPKDEPGQASQATFACNMPPYWHTGRSDQRLDCETNYLDGLWEGSCVGSSEGGAEETFPFRVVIDAPGQLADALPQKTPTYGTTTLGKTGDWIQYHNDALYGADPSRTPAWSRWSQAFTFLHCVSASCEADADDGFIIHQQVRTGAADDDKRPGLGGTFAKDYVKFGGGGPLDGKDATGRYFMNYSVQIEGQVTAPRTTGAAFEGACRWSTSTKLDINGADAPVWVVRTGRGSLKWKSCFDSLEIEPGKPVDITLTSGREGCRPADGCDLDAACRACTTQRCKDEQMAAWGACKQTPKVSCPDPRDAKK